MFYEEVFKEFELKGVRYLLVGGLAANLYGCIRFTMDMDIMVDLGEENLHKVIEVMDKLNYHPRVPVSSEELTKEERRQEWLKEKDAKVFTFIHRQKPFRQVDLFLSNPIDFDEAFMKKQTISIEEGITVDLISLDDLIVLKNISGRPRDLEDIKHLKRIKDLRGT
jgi:hypothetical protein